MGQFTVNVAGERRRGLQLRGDILIKCYHRSDSGRETIFACQFHTCAVADYTLSFTRQELDGACNGMCIQLQSLPNASSQVAVAVPINFNSSIYNIPLKCYVEARLINNSDYNKNHAFNVRICT